MRQLRHIKYTTRRIACRLVMLLPALLVCATGTYAYDHPAHMTIAAIAFDEIEKANPELAEKLELLFMAHPDASAFWVAAGDTKGKERAKRMFIEGARWADDTKGSIFDRPTWHTARWALVAKDAPPEAKAAA